MNPILVVIRDGAAGFTRNMVTRLVAGTLLTFVKVTQVEVEDEYGNRYEMRADALGKVRT